MKAEIQCNQESCRIDKHMVLKQLILLKLESKSNSRKDHSLT